MLEKTKKWCSEKMEKGKEFYENNKFFLGWMSALSADLVFTMALAKIFEPKKSQLEVWSIKPEFDTDSVAYIEARYLNRFGPAVREVGVLLNEDECEMVLNSMQNAIELAKKKKEQS